MFSDKYLKNWYLLPIPRSAALTPPACLEGVFAHAETREIMQPSRMTIPPRRIAEKGQRNSRSAHDCIMNVRITTFAHENSSMSDRVIGALRKRRFLADCFEISMRVLRAPLRSTSAERRPVEVNLNPPARRDMAVGDQANAIATASAAGDSMIRWVDRVIR
jgi:hypothetical protein